MPAPAAISLPSPENSGFLRPEESAGLFEADVYIAAMGRAGSTMLCDLMTVPGESVCLMEPWFVEGCRSEAIRAQLARAGVAIEKPRWWKDLTARRHEDYLLRYQELLAPQLRLLKRWGVKEVRGEFHRPTIETIHPQRILVLVRDLRDVVLSLQVKMGREGNLDAEARWEWIKTYIALAAQGLLTLLEDPGLQSKIVIARYEDVTRSTEARAALSHQLDWPLAGQPNASFEALGRGAEAEPFAGEVRPGAARYRAVAEPELRARIAALAEQHAAYQGSFGYDGR